MMTVRKLEVIDFIVEPTSKEQRMDVLTLTKFDGERLPEDITIIPKEIFSLIFTFLSQEDLENVELSRKSFIDLTDAGWKNLRDKDPKNYFNLRIHLQLSWSDYTESNRDLFFLSEFFDTLVDKAFNETITIPFEKYDALLNRCPNFKKYTDFFLGKIKVTPTYDKTFSGDYSFSLLQSITDCMKKQMDPWTFSYSLKKTTYPLYLFSRTLRDKIETVQILAKKRQLAIQAGENKDYKLFCCIINDNDSTLLIDLYNEGYRYPPLLWKLAKIYRGELQDLDKEVNPDINEIRNGTKIGIDLIEEAIKGSENGTQYTVNPWAFLTAGELYDISAKYEINLAKKVTYIEKAAGYYATLIKKCGEEDFFSINYADAGRNHLSLALWLCGTKREQPLLEKAIHFLNVYNNSYGSEYKFGWRDSGLAFGHLYSLDHK